MSILSKNSKEAISVLNSNRLSVAHRVELIEGLLLFDDAVDNDIDPMWGYILSNSWMVFSWNGFVQDEGGRYYFSYSEFCKGVYSWLQDDSSFLELPELLPQGFKFGDLTYINALKSLNDALPIDSIKFSAAQVIFSGFNCLDN